MPNSRKPAARGDGLPRLSVLLSGKNSDQDSPSTSAYQQLASDHWAEARDLTGAAKFAALCLVAHYGQRMSRMGGAHG